jgi:hypothetical protein
LPPSLRWEGLAVGITFIAGGTLVAVAGGCNKPMAKKIGKDLFHHKVTYKILKSMFQRLLNLL